MLKEPDKDELSSLTDSLIIQGASPTSSLSQLLKNSIIRDEHIAALSLDLKETQRYQVLCDAIGALGSDQWTEKAARLVSEAQRRTRLAETDVQNAILAVNTESARVAQLDAAIMPPERIRDAANSLRGLLDSAAQEPELVNIARLHVSEIRSTIERLRSTAPTLARL
jgi:hypothetical protein